MQGPAVFMDLSLEDQVSNIKSTIKVIGNVQLLEDMIFH